jgi:hypothetical protein
MRCRLASARRISQPSQDSRWRAPAPDVWRSRTAGTRLRPQLFRLQLHQVSSYTSHVSGLVTGVTDRLLERRGLGCPLGILRAAEGGKSGVGEVAFATVDTGQYYRVRHIIPRPHGHNMGRSWFTMLWNSLSLPRAEYATNFKVVHYPTDDLFKSRSSPRTAWWFSCSSKHMRTRPRGSSCPRRSLPTPKSQSSAICFYEEIPER